VCGITVVQGLTKSFAAVNNQGNFSTLKITNQGTTLGVSPTTIGDVIQCTNKKKQAANETMQRSEQQLLMWQCNCGCNWCSASQHHLNLV
jgi:hypothetical protein